MWFLHAYGTIVGILYIIYRDIFYSSDQVKIKNVHGVYSEDLPVSIRMLFQINQRAL